jgi:phospholipase/carboxylesterase
LLGASLAGVTTALATVRFSGLLEGDELVLGKRRHASNSNREAGQEGRLLARPSEKAAGKGAVGLHSLGEDGGRGGLLYVPGGYRADRPAPLALMLHGAGGHAEHGMGLLRGLADRTGLILLAPASRQGTWDVILGEYGPDVAFIDAALDRTFRDYNVDPHRVAIGGFSDGASYALSLGLTNGDLFTHVLAFSPGFMAPAAHRGRPRLFLSHGTDDQVLPIDLCSRRMVPRLEKAGYDVRYREFEGPHTVPPEIAREAADWFVPERGRGAA